MTRPPSDLFLFLYFRAEASECTEPLLLRDEVITMRQALLPKQKSFLEPRSFPDTTPRCSATPVPLLQPCCEGRCIQGVVGKRRRSILGIGSPEEPSCILYFTVS